MECQLQELAGKRKGRSPEGNVEQNTLKRQDRRISLTKEDLEAETAERRSMIAALQEQSQSPEPESSEDATVLTLTPHPQEEEGSDDDLPEPGPVLPWSQQESEFGQDVRHIAEENWNLRLKNINPRPEVKTPTPQDPTGATPNLDQDSPVEDPPLTPNQPEPNSPESNSPEPKSPNPGSSALNLPTSSPDALIIDETAPDPLTTDASKGDGRGCVYKEISPKISQSPLRHCPERAVE